jgi:D-arabinose 1-dehydrogenase-like Zn-dependent alcohol dehydrogenase
VTKSAHEKRPSFFHKIQAIFCVSLPEFLESTRVRIGMSDRWLSARTHRRQLSSTLSGNGGQTGGQEGSYPGDLVAVQGIGGLGHLGVQFANKFGYKVAAIGRGSGNAELAKMLGASVYIDSNATNAAEALQKLGGAKVILATAPSSKAMSELIDGLGPNGKFIVVGAAFDPIEVTPIQLITGSKSIQGWTTGTPADAEDTLHFAELSGVRPMIETYPLEQAAEAYARMLSGKAEFRVVLTM